MASRKEYEMLFQLNAQLGSNYNSSFKTAQSAVTSMQREIQALSKTQADISAFQKQQNALESNRAKLANLQQQYDNIQREMQETGTYSSDLANKLLAKQQQIDKTSASVDRQTQKLQEMGAALRDAGVDTNNLERESARLGSAIEELKGQQEDAAQGAEDFSETSTSAFEAVSQALVSAGIAAGLKEITDAYMECIEGAGDFEEAMSNVEALSGASGEDMAKLASMAKDLGATTKFTAEEAADAMGYMAMAGWDANSMLSGMDGVLQLAAASGEDLARVSDIVTDNLTAFGLSAADTAHFSDVLAAAATSSNTSVSIMGETFKNSASVAGALGYSIEDVAIATGLMANAGVKGSRAGTALRNIFNGLLDGVTLTSEAFGEFEYSAVKADGTMTSFSETVDTLRGYFEQMSEAERVSNARVIAGERGYNGLLAILNATNEDYQSLAATINNCSGAAQRMADIKLDNMNGELTIMKSAWDALKMSVGEQFTPEMRKTYGVLTDVFNSVNKFIRNHPAVVKAVTAFVGVLGVATAGLAAYSAGAKIAAAASALMSASIPGVGIIMAVVGGVAALTAGAVALGEALKDNLPSVEELTEAAQEMNEVTSAAKAQYSDTATEILATANMADRYISRLEEMGDYSELNNEQQEEYRRILTLLTQTVPELADKIDIENGYIEGGTEALRANTAAWKENATAQAFQEELTELYSAQADVLLEAEKNRLKLTKAETEAGEANAEAARIEARKNEIYAKAADLAEQLNEEQGNTANSAIGVMHLLGDEADEYYRLIQEEAHWLTVRDEANAEAERYREAIAADEEAVSQAEATIQETEDAIASLTAAMSNSNDEAGEAVEVNGELQTAIAEVYAQVDALAEAYAEAYHTAYDSVSGQYAIWDEAAEKIPTSIDSINEALSGQVNYWQDYNANLQSLAERAEDIEGLSTVIASFADGSEESVNAVAGMAAASDEDLAAMVASWQELKKEQETVSESIAGITTSYENCIDLFQAAIESEIGEMELSSQAKTNAVATIQGYIDGANSMIPQVQNAYNAVAYAAERALYGYAGGSGSSIHYSVPGYASGTTDAERGWKLVGENGPELEFFNGGESVLNARDTSSVISALSADIAGGRGDGEYVVTFSPVYNINGSANSEEIESVLRQHDADLHQMFLDWMEEIGADAARRTYR